MSEPRVLVVEDDEALRVGLVDNLEDEGYRVRAAATCGEARAALLEAPADVVVLDIMLPDGDGYALCHELRQQGFAGMVLMLTARTLEGDVVAGFESGADDYLAKPYRLKELLVRVRALLRRPGRSQVSEARGFRLGAFVVDAEARAVTDEHGGEVELTRTELDLLLLLLRRTGRALSRDEILDEVWGRDVVVDTRTVDNFVSSLKKKLSWSPSSGWRIRTVRGVGYRLEVD